MDIKEISDNLQKIYSEMAQTFMDYQKSTGLNCPTGCGACCFNPEVETTMSEMLPFAFKALEENKIDFWIDTIKNAAPDICPLLEKGQDLNQGKCRSYHERPAVCRMFGVSGIHDKHQKAALSICKILKESSHERVIEINKSFINAPHITQWMSYINDLAPFESKTSIKKASLAALQKVSLFAQYH